MRELILERDSKNRPSILLQDIIEVLLRGGHGKKIAEYLLCEPVFADAVDVVVKGLSDHEWFGRDEPSATTLRNVLAKQANPAAQEVITHLAKELASARDVIKTQREEMNRLLDKWPEPYKQYKPELPLIFGRAFIPQGIALKLIAVIEEQGNGK